MTSNQQASSDWERFVVKISFFTSTSTKWLNLSFQDAGSQLILQIFLGILPLLNLYLSSTKPLPILYQSPTYLLPTICRFSSKRISVLYPSTSVSNPLPYGSGNYSQFGNILFPVWEHFIPNVGIIISRFAKNLSFNNYQNTP